MTAEKMMELADELEGCVTRSGGIDLRDPALLWKAATALRSSAVGAGAREAAIEECIQAVEGLRVKHAGADAGPGCDYNLTLDDALKAIRALPVRPEAPAGVRAETIEECAKVADDCHACRTVARKIRALPSDPVRRTTQPIQRDSTALNPITQQGGNK